MTKRQLSAIMFTDLAGYTAMMQEDETGAKRIRDEHREILEREIEQHDGRILQYYGDGALSIFSSTLAASNSAISIQKASLLKSIPLKIGIHTGDVVIEDDGVYGDGVNIASRIESFSVAGSVMISDKVYDDIKNHQKFKPALMGEFELKNVKKPIEVYALTNDGLKVPQRTELKGKVKERIKSIVVLPFTNQSTDPENEYFCDGLTEELIAAFSKRTGLRVISRSSSFSLKGTQTDIRQLGEQLQVQSVLDGSVRKSGSKLRVTAQLGSTQDGYQLWTETYNRTEGDAFELQDDITESIVEQLKAKRLLSNTDDKEPDSVQINPEAYDLYLKGLYYYNKWTPDNAAKAADIFQQAIDLEPQYDQAFAGQALAYSLMATTGFINPAEGSRKSVKAANIAISINPNNENAYAALAVNDYFFEWNFKQGSINTQKALDINPKSAQVNITRSLAYLVAADMDGALACLKVAREIDPLSVVINRTLADVYYFKEDYKIAIELYDWLLEKDPEFKAAVEFKAWSYLMMGAYDTAISIFESIHGDAVHALMPYVQLGYAYALKGDKEQALYYLDKLKEQTAADPQGFHDFNFATLYTGLQMKDEAFKYLRKCVEAKIGAMVFFHSSPLWKPLRSDPRFQELIKEMQLPQPLLIESRKTSL